MAALFALLTRSRSIDTPASIKRFCKSATSRSAGRTATALARTGPADPLAAIRAGAGEGVPLLVGTNLEEWKLFALMTTPAADEGALLRRLALVAPDPADALAAYRAEHPDAGPGDLEGAVLTDVVFRMPAVRLADAHAAHAPVFQYRFDWRSPAFGGMIGASHAVEIPFVFDLVEDHRLHVFVGPEAPARLAGAMHRAWVDFAASGAPSAPELPEWPSINGGGRPVMRFDEDSSLQFDPQAATTKYWLEADA